MTDQATIKDFTIFPPCRDAEQTRAFYEDLLGLPLVNFMSADRVPILEKKNRIAHVL